MNRVADLMNRTRWAWIVSLIVVHVGFGLAHAYQGIIAHGVGDTIDFLLIFGGKYPWM